MKQGLIHLYYGEGKGKTTAAMGLALRAIYAGKKVVILQFLKGRASGEIILLEQLGAKIYRGKYGSAFVAEMSDAERAETRALHMRNLQAAAEENADVLILDEVCAVWQLDMAERVRLREIVLQKPPEQEVILTGRKPAAWMIEAADYCTEMKCHKHPFQKGIAAREGVEF